MLAAAIEAKSLSMEEHVALERQLRDQAWLEAELQRQESKTADALLAVDQTSQQVSALESRALEGEEVRKRLAAQNSALHSQHKELQQQLEASHSTHQVHTFHPQQKAQKTLTPNQSLQRSGSGAIWQ